MTYNQNLNLQYKKSYLMIVFSELGLQAKMTIKPLCSSYVWWEGYRRVRNNNTKNKKYSSYAHISIHISADFGQGDLHSVSNSSIAC